MMDSFTSSNGEIRCRNSALQVLKLFSLHVPIIYLREIELVALLKSCCVRSFPRDAVGWSAVCDCGMSLSQSRLGYTLKIT